MIKLFSKTKKWLLKKRYPQFDLFGKDVLSIEDSNDWIRDRIRESGAPFAVARLGSQECSGFWQQLFWEWFPFLPYPKEDKRMLAINTGMFSTNCVGRCFFAKMMKRALRVIDATCILGAKEEGEILRKYAGKEIPYLSLEAIEFESFRLFRDPWTNALANKRVLVVSPFAQLVDQQYEKRDQIHCGVFKLPTFDLVTFKAPLTQGGEDARFKSWKQALLYIFNNTKDIPFDVALLGCGSYGLPLQGMYKKIGKSSIYLGGTLSPLFGIFGERWKNMPYLNSFWVRPGEEDKPKCAPLIENGCYW